MINIGLMILAGFVIIALVRYGLCAGLDQIADARRWNGKTRGQVTGFATSVPELVCLVATGLSGVWEAGLWNIASSNIINCLLLATAMLAYRQQRDLLNLQFVDELCFAALAVAVPLVLMELKLDRSVWLVPGLFAFFLLYRWVDKKSNTHVASVDDVDSAGGSMGRGCVFVAIALIGIIFVGNFLGAVTQQVVENIGIPAAIAGCILGLITSLPEMTTFFVVYGNAKKADKLDTLDDTQEALDNLTSSNMANVGFVYPFGLGVFLLVMLLRG